MQGQAIAPPGAPDVIRAEARGPTHRRLGGTALRSLPRGVIMGKHVDSKFILSQSPPAFTIG